MDQRHLTKLREDPSDNAHRVKSGVGYDTLIVIFGKIHYRSDVSYWNQVVPMDQAPGRESRDVNAIENQVKIANV